MNAQTSDRSIHDRSTSINTDDVTKCFRTRVSSCQLRDIMPLSTFDKFNILKQQLEKLEPNATFTSTPHGFTSSSGTTYFAKLGSSREKDQYIGEAESLIAINTAAPGLAPHILAFGVDNNTDLPYFISQYKNLSPLTGKAAQALGKRLATELHMYTKGGHGFGLKPSDKPCATWPQRCEEWMRSEGLLKAASGEPESSKK